MNQPGNPVIAFAYLAIAPSTGGRGPPGQMKGTLGTSNGCVVQYTDFGALGAAWHPMYPIPGFPPGHGHPQPLQP
jgi:hypothetical protein